MRRERPVYALLAAVILGGCSVANSNLPGASYFAFEGKAVGGESVLADGAHATSPMVTNTPNGISYRALTFSSEKSYGLRASEVEWSLVHGLRVADGNQEVLLRRLDESIRQALQACLPEFGPFKTAADIPQEVATLPARIVIDGITHIQYPLTIVEWSTQPADKPNAGRAFRVKSVKVVAFGTQHPVSVGRAVDLVFDIRFHDVVNDIIDGTATGLSAPVDVATVTGSCDDGKLVVTGKKHSLPDSGWLSGIRGNFNLKAVLTHQTGIGN